jgi:predicted TIM-barrel fold metal-dependent hydrolase
MTVGAAKLLSADSHVFEPTKVWDGLLPASFWPDGGKGFAEKPAGHDPLVRLVDMDTDTVSAEVLYPSLGLQVFSIEDVELHEASCRAYNDWLAEYCAAAPDRLIGIGMIPTFDIDHAVQELERCADANMKGILVWQAPHPDLPFTSTHYDPLWEVAQARNLPVSLHILTGFNYSRDLVAGRSTGLDVYRGSVNLKLATAVDALFDFVVGGTLERFPDLKLIFVENEVGWAPFVLDQFDYYFNRFRNWQEVPITRAPSDIFTSQVFLTYFRDPMVGRLLSWWGQDNIMWSSDYPHGNTTWPNSRSVVETTLKDTASDVYAKVTAGTAQRLYGLTALA